VRKIGRIPVPKVLDWSDCSTNPIGVEYIIMEHAKGVQLHSKWSDITPLQQRRCVRSLANAMKSMSALSFPAYGSIYFADAPIDSASKVGLGDEFFLGPVCSRDYWNCIPGSHDITNDESRIKVLVS
jgi:hypothetical protein